MGLVIMVTMGARKGGQEVGVVQMNVVIIIVIGVTQVHLGGDIAHDRDEVQLVVLQHLSCVTSQVDHMMLAVTIIHIHNREWNIL